MSSACLTAAVYYSSTAEKLLYQTGELDAFVKHLQTLASIWAWIGWVLHAAVATVLSAGINAKRVVRRVFIALGVLIAADGVALLISAVLIH
jgi:hypothetical protein